METFDLISLLHIDTHAATQEQRIFEGMASVFGAPVQAFVPTIIDKGAFTRTLRENGSRVVLLNQHNTAEPLGKPIELKETDVGLYLKGRLSKTQAASDVWCLLQEKILDGLSIGFNPVKTYSKTENGESWRHIQDLDLLEISLVTFPADAKARITATHGVQIALSNNEKLVQLEQLRRWLDGMQKNNVPEFSEIFGPGWIS